MAKITGLTAWATPIGADVLAIVDTVGSSTKKITYANLLANMPVGVAATPTLSFTGDADSGFYRIGADNIGLSLNAAKVVDFAATQIGFPDGVVAGPGISFTADTDSGIYRIGANNIGIAVNATKILDIATTGLSVAGALLPTTNDGGALGSTSLKWSDLFLAALSVINWNSGDVTLTHGTNYLFFEGGGEYAFNNSVYVGATLPFALRSSAAGSNLLNIFNGTAPVGTLTNGCSIYSTSGELYTMDAAGNATLQTPHDKDGNWVFLSKNTVTGRVLEIDMEKMMRRLDEMLGGGFVRERME